VGPAGRVKENVMFARELKYKPQKNPGEHHTVWETGVQRDLTAEK